MFSEALHTKNMWSSTPHPTTASKKKVLNAYLRQAQSMQKSNGLANDTMQNTHLVQRYWVAPQSWLWSPVSQWCGKTLGCKARDPPVNRSTARGRRGKPAGRGMGNYYNRQRESKNIRCPPGLHLAGRGGGVSLVRIISRHYANELDCVHIDTILLCFFFAPSSLVFFLFFGIILTFMSDQR